VQLCGELGQRADLNAERARFFVGVTGAQGVGKSTFCNALSRRIEQSGLTCALLAGLGEAIRKDGYSLGAEAKENAVLAVMTAHLRRQREAPPGIVVLDRCPIDMLAYIRALSLPSGELQSLGAELVSLFVSAAGAVVYLQMGPLFKNSRATHEPSPFRLSVDQHIQAILREMGGDVISVDAGQPTSVDVVVAEVMRRIEISSMRDTA
jgi:thymidylate kinase